MKKHRIVLASVLKPVDDTRMYEKLGRSLARHTTAEVFVIGYPTSAIMKDSAIQVIQLSPFNRIGIARLLVPLRIVKNWYQIKPDVIIVNTHELLITSVVFKLVFRCRIIYDVQENYGRNILWTDAFPLLLRSFLATWVRSKEWLTAPFFDLFFLAEKGFEQERNLFRKKKHILLANKSALPDGFVRTGSANRSRLLFSGTLAPGTGVMEAIQLADQLHWVDPSIELQIIGYCALPSFLRQIRSAIANKPFIQLTGGDRLVPHDKIVEQIATSDFGVICYDLKPHVINKVPTKLYEYLHAQLPILLQDHPPWVQMCSNVQAAVVVDFTKLDARQVLNQIRHRAFYHSSPSGVAWTDEEPNLIAALNNFLV
jgi:hypothetical protein